MTDRSQAISLVEAALKAGRIVQADHDMRLDQIKNASSQQDVDIVVRDLHVPGSAGAGAAVAATGTPVAATPAAGQPWPLVNYGPGQGHTAAAVDLSTVTKGGGKWVGGIIGLVVLISVIVPIAGVVIGLVSAKDSFDQINFAEPTDETTYLPGQPPGDNGVNVHTTEGYDELMTALADETGSTQVFSATMYPRYAVLSVPEKPTGKRYRSWYWDGRTLTQNTFKSTTDEPRLDLADVDYGVAINLLQDVRGRIDDPSSWYVSIDSIASDGPRLAIYASNEYGEGAYVLADLAGNVTYESTY